MNAVGRACLNFQMLSSLQKIYTPGNKSLAVRESRMKVITHAQLALPLLQNIYTARASIQKHGADNVWPW